MDKVTEYYTLVNSSKDPSKDSSKESGQNVFRPQDLADFQYDRDLGEPGRYPFTRGIYRDMYRSRFWTMRQYAGFGDADATNRRFRYLLDNGQTGLSVAFDLPTQMGLDSDDAMALGEVGRTGVAIDTLKDMERLFDQDRPRQSLHLYDHQFHIVQFCLPCTARWE
jgi:methylmalonyl-CoA mutase N-terminal domain/subunit